MANVKFISKVQQIQQVLEPLLVQHHTLVSSFADNARANLEKVEIVNQSMTNVELELEDAELMLISSLHLQKEEAELQLLRMQVQRLSKENTWLCDELSVYEERLESSKAVVAQLEEEKSKIEHEELKTPTGSCNEHLSDQSFSTLPSDLFSDEEPPEQHSPSKRLPRQRYGVSPRLRTIQNLALQNAAEGRYEVAVPLCKQVIEELENTTGHDHPDIAKMLDILVRQCRDQRKYKEAIILLTDALLIREKTLDETHPTVAATLSNLAALFGYLGKYREAEPFSQRALEIRERVLGENHPDVAKQLNNLALIYQMQSKYSEVERCYERALQIYESELGPEDPIVSKTRNNLAHCYRRQGKFKDAEVLYQQVLSVAHENEFGKNKPKQTAEEPKANGGKTKPRDSAAYSLFGSWHKMAKVSSPTVLATLQRIAGMYRRQGGGALQNSAKGDTTNGESNKSHAETKKSTNKKK